MAIKFEWTPAISVGDEAIDNQHKRLLSKVNELLSAIIENRESLVLAEIIGFLSAYIDDHFVYEEKYMLDHHYPDFEEHKKLHDDFREKYKKFDEEFRVSGADNQLVLEVENYIGNWWLNHISKEDKKYSLYIAGNK